MRARSDGLDMLIDFDGSPQHANLMQKYLGLSVFASEKNLIAQG